MHMKVGGDSSASGLSEVSADIEPVSFVELFESVLYFNDQLEEFELFLFAEIIEISDFAIRKHHGMAGVVGKGIENRETGFTTGNDMIFFILVFVDHIQKKI